MMKSAKRQPVLIMKWCVELPLVPARYQSIESLIYRWHFLFTKCTLKPPINFTLSKDDMFALGFSTHCICSISAQIDGAWFQTHKICTCVLQSPDQTWLCNDTELVLQFNGRHSDRSNKNLKIVNKYTTSIFSVTLSDICVYIFKRQSCIMLLNMDLFPIMKLSSKCTDVVYWHNLGPTIFQCGH